MANKKKVEAREKARQKQKTEKTIMYIGIGVVVLVILGIAWMLWPGSTPPEAAAPTEANASAFDPYSTGKQYDAYPPMTIDTGKQYFATFKMANGGEFKVQLFPDKAPKTVNSFVFLAKDKFYDGTTFHRVLEGFMAQGGDPTGTGGGGPGYEFEDEFSDLTFDREGLLAMANAGPNTNGSQFFITFAPTPHLNGLHTIFGEVVEGMDVVRGITLRDPNTGPDYSGDVIESITITEQ